MQVDFYPWMMGTKYSDILSGDEFPLILAIKIRIKEDNSIPKR